MVKYDGYSWSVTVQQCHRFGQADRRCGRQVRKPGRSSEDVVLLNGYELLADSGYFSEVNVTACEGEKITPYIAVASEQLIFMCYAGGWVGQPFCPAQHAIVRP